MTISWPPGSLLSMFLHGSTLERHLADKNSLFLVHIVYKTNKKIIWSINYIKMRLIKFDDYSL